MNIRQAAERIKDTVPMGDVLSLYGMEPNREGFIRCPFHSGDHTASLKVYKGRKGWSCFGCHAGGSVIDFVMKMDEITFSDAVRKIDSELNLGLCRVESFNSFFAKKKDETRLRAEYAKYINGVRERNRAAEAEHLKWVEVWQWLERQLPGELSADEDTLLLWLRDTLGDEQIDLAAARREEEVSYYEWENKRDQVCGG